MTKQQARQLISTNVPDPDNEMYYRRTSAMKVWERSINNMGVCLNYLNEREKVPYEEIMSMMMQLQKCQLSIVNNDFTIKKIYGRFFSRIKFNNQWRPRDQIWSSIIM